MGELEYNFDQMISDIKKNRNKDMDNLSKLINDTVNDEFLVC